VSAEEAALELLGELGVADDEAGAYLARVLLELPGWAGLFRRLERDASSFHGDDVPAPRLSDYLAVRLAYEVRAIAWSGRDVLGRDLPPLAQLRAHLEARYAIDTTEPRELTAFRLAETFELAGCGPTTLWNLSTPDLGRVLDRLDRFDEPARGRIFHEAYERSHGTDVLDGLAANASFERSPSPPPTAQMWFCIDEREESIRRHVEEVAPDVETIGVAGFFGLPVRFRGLDDPHERALCPVNVAPAHVIREIPEAETAGHASSRSRIRYALGWLSSFLGHGSRGLGRGVLLTPWLGVVAAAELFLRIFFPRFSHRLVHASGGWLAAPRTRVTALVGRDADDAGMTIGEAADRLAGNPRQPPRRHPIACLDDPVTMNPQ
jgi:uncharacterized protein YbcC (UPF0753/DUF2309 family)